MKVLLALALLASSLAAQTTTYVATSGSVHPYPAVSATLELGNDPYTQFTLVQLGSGFHRVLYSLPNGDSADLEDLAGTVTTLSGYRSYKFDGIAGESKVAVTYKWHVNTSRYGGLVFDGGVLTVTK